MHSDIIARLGFDFDNGFEFTTFVNGCYSFFFNLNFVCRYEFIVVSVDII